MEKHAECKEYDEAAKALWDRVDLSVVHGDVTNPGTLDEVMNGADALFCAITPHPLDPDFFEKHTALVGGAIVAAQRNGVRRVVLVGGGGVLALPSSSRLAGAVNPLYDQYNRAHRVNHDALEGAGFAEWTMICPGFMIDDNKHFSRQPAQRLFDVNNRLAHSRGILELGGLCATFGEVGQVCRGVLRDTSGQYNRRRVGIASLTGYWRKFLHGILISSKLAIGMEPAVMESPKVSSTPEVIQIRCD
jgi:hypothetical protein